MGVCRTLILDITKIGIASYIKKHEKGRRKRERRRRF